MQTDPQLKIDDPHFACAAFDIADLADEIRVDQLCQQLLRCFCAELVQRGLTPLDAGRMAHGADYFLRDFIIADRCANLFTITPRHIQQFAGNWYIVRNLEPNLTELGQILDGVAHFYSFCAEHGKITAETADTLIAACTDRDQYAARIESFWQISGDGYDAWERACSLKG